MVAERPAPVPPPIRATPDTASAIEAGRAAWLARRWTLGADAIPDPRGFWLVRRADGRFDADRVGATLGSGDRAIEQHWRTGSGVWQHRQISAHSGQMVEAPALPGAPMYSRSIREIPTTVRVRRREVEE